MQEPPNLFENGDAPDLPARPTTTKAPTPPPVPSPTIDIDEQARMLKQYEEQQAALKAQREAEEQQRRDQELQRQLEFEAKQREQAERERQAQEQFALQSQYAQYNNAAATRVNELERDLIGMRGQFERDQLLLEQYDRVRYISYIGNSQILMTMFRGSKLLKAN